ncbi:MAG: cyclase family protein [Acidobacteriota bacterium]
MKRVLSILSLLIYFTALLACQKEKALPTGQWIDLSYEFSNQTIYWPTSDPFQLETVFSGKTEQGYYYAANKFSAAEHGGTHVDAPLHFAEGHRSLDQIPIQQLIAAAIKIDVSRKALNNRDYLITVEDLTNWEGQNGAIPNNAILFLYTGYCQYWPDRVKYLGTDKRGTEGVAELHFPGLHPDAARWLVENRKLSAIGLDTASIDYGQSQRFESHQVLASENIPIFENVAQLDKLPSKGAIAIALPIKIKGGSGGPLRLVALIPE